MPSIHSSPRRRRLGLVLALGALSLLSLSGTSPAAAESGAANGLDVSYYSFFEGWGQNLYPLDPVPRFLERGQRLRCNGDDIVRYRSRELRYTVRVHPAFRERLQRFERFLTELSVDHYGRAPRRLVHRGAFACRSARARRGRISEHAFGNALDLQGFDFPALRRSQEAPEEMPRHVRRAFRLRVISHWSPRRARDAYHAQFLHRLAEGLRRRPEHLPRHRGTAEAATS